MASGGVVRTSAVHYTSVEVVGRLVEQVRALVAEVDVGET